LLASLIVWLVAFDFLFGTAAVVDYCYYGGDDDDDIVVVVVVVVDWAGAIVLQNPPDWQEILLHFRGNELQNYFTKILEDNLKVFSA
jgi:hypothetical protein